jgi:hypothetical protein
VITRAALASLTFTFTFTLLYFFIPPRIYRALCPGDLERRKRRIVWSGAWQRHAYQNLRHSRGTRYRTIWCLYIMLVVGRKGHFQALTFLSGCRRCPTFLRKFQHNTVTWREGLSEGEIVVRNRDSGLRRIDNIFQDMCIYRTQPHSGTVQEIQEQCK